uniref:TGFB1 factor n=1 Tax=Macrostomum lignano TaxID=282301 RepID=A0A1I8FHP6_9PLAT
ITRSDHHQASAAAAAAAASGALSHRGHILHSHQPPGGEATPGQPSRGAGPHGLAQIADEKLALQKALLLYENLHGRPSHKRDKELIRPLYDRYRQVKKLLARADGGAGDGDGATTRARIPSGGYDWSAGDGARAAGGAARPSRAGSSDFLVTQDFSLLRQTAAAPAAGPPLLPLALQAASAAATNNLALLTEEIRLTKEEKYKLQKLLKNPTP